MVARLASLPQATGLRVAAGVAATGAYLGFVQLWNPYASHALACPIHAVTGLWCPGCGSTRASYDLMHGRVVEAFHNNVFLPIAIVVLAYCVVVGSRRIPARWIQLGAGALVLFTVARNLPGLEFLAPLGGP